MKQSEIITALTRLGEALSEIKMDNPILEKTFIHNKWFTIDAQLLAISYWKSQLTEETIKLWLSPYTFSKQPKTIGLVMAGNIPLVGIHDLFSILLSGHKAQVKTSSDDSILTPWLIKTLIDINLQLEERIAIADKLSNCDAVIATGSNNTARYFHYYFKDIPHIVRKNRNSIAVLSGKETEAELNGLADDIFLYHGLGCRNVSKLLLPEKYDFKAFFDAIEKYSDRINHHKYYNNYTYHKALFLMNLEKHLDNGFIILKEDEKLASPLGCLFFSYYKERNDIIEYIDNHKDQIQVVIGNFKFLPECEPFGKSQFPSLNTYADDIDTIAFLNNL